MDILRGIRKLRRSVNVALRRDLHLAIEASAALHHIGTEYGGYWIQADQLDKNSVVYSFGVGEDISFDIVIVNQFGCEVFAFDPTPKSVRWIQAQKTPREFKFVPWGVASFDGQGDFYPPRNPDHVSHSLALHRGLKPEGIKAEFRRVVTLMKHFGHERIDLLKMDIEGGEFAVIGDIARDEIEIGQVCVEFHHRFSGFGIDDTLKAVEDLRRIGLRLCRQDDCVCTFVGTGVHS